LTKEGEETTSTILFTEGTKQISGKEYREDFTDGSAADILLVSAKLSSGI
jgi:hypothetical protein